MDYPFVVQVNIYNETVADLYEKIYKVVHIFVASKSKLSSFSEFYSNLRLHAINTLPETTGFLSSSKSICEFCGDKCSYCFFKVNEKGLDKNSINTGTKLIDLYKKLSSKRQTLAFYLSLKEVSKTLQMYYPKSYMSDSFKGQIIKSTEITLFDCLELFRSEEKLEQENAWYCSKCKKHQEATVKMQIYRPPTYLIISLKRFKHKSGNSMIGFMSNKKNDTTVNYPLDLDLKDHILGNYNSKYELFAISQHYGGLSSGHYTALCKNNDNWLEFDDESVTKINNKEIVTNSAYLLFYKMK